MSSDTKLDRIDRKILMALQSNARITNQDLAAQVNLSPSSCLTRVKKLEQNNYITSYRAVVNLPALCRSISCIATVTIQSQTKEDFRAFEHYVNGVAEIVECYTVSGAFDFFLKIVCPDMQHYLELTNELIDAIPFELTINTHVVMNDNKLFSGYPLEALL